MNRFKKEIRKRGYKLESDYPCMPYDIKGKFGEPGHIALDSVTVNTERCEIFCVFNVIVEKVVFSRAMEAESTVFY